MLKIITSKTCWNYGQEGHPESPARVSETYKYLESLGFGFTEAVKCEKSDVLKAHTERLVKQVASGDYFESDTPAYSGIYDYALLSAGAAVAAMKSCLNKENSFSLMRPPGHHAGRDTFGGFCYFNNIAVAVKKSFGMGISRAAILDIDCHHGNGTQNVFLGDKRALFASLHQVPLYPGTGLNSEKNCINFPLPPHTTETKYLEALESALSKIMDFKPELLAVSAGFDTYEGDPITHMSLKKETYGKIAQMIAQTGLQRFAVLEGGYSEDLPVCIGNFLSEL